MATAEDILNKSRTKKRSAFQAVQRRSWDYLGASIDENPQAEATAHNAPKTVENAAEIILPQAETIPNTGAENKLQTSGNSSFKDNVDSPSKDAVQKKLLTLKGYQKQIMRLITTHIKSRGGSPYTVVIFPNILADKIKANIAVTKMSLKRLVEKNLLVRLKGEKGRNGCCKFRAREDVVKVCFTLFNDSPCDINLTGNETDE